MQHLSRCALSTAVATVVATVGFAATAQPASASPAGDELVISEVYGGGGNSGGAYRSDFIELHNPTAAAVDLGGLSLHYRSAAGGSGGAPVPLSGSVPAGSRYLVKAADGSNTAQPALPEPDATVAFNMSGTAGQVFLLDGAAFTGSGNAAGAAGVVDMVGWGSAATFETAAAPATTNATSVARNADGTDTDSNAADFTAGPPSPEAAGDGGGDPDPDPEPTEPVTIADVQGTGSASPLAGATVTTEGVVTAAYPTGGFNGFYIQTPGADTTPGASDGLFVFGPTFDESTLEPGDSVEVTGAVSEFNGLTEITATTVTEVADLGDVLANAEIPGTDCTLPGTGCLTGAALDAAREELEGEAFLPTGNFTVTDAYDGSASNPPHSGSSNFFGEIGLAANSTEPLITPTEVVDAQDTAGVAARVAYNNAHRVVLDDGSTTTYWNTSNTGRMDQPLPWFTPEHQVRVGAAVTFDQPVVLDYRFGWKIQPVRPVTGAPSGLVSFEQDRPAAPAEVGGDVRLATFNVLNYFTTLGVDYGGCSSFKDRDGNPIAVNACPGNGPRGAWDQRSFERQQAKIVNAINALEADVVSVEEIENSIVVDGHDRDEALSALVVALNASAGAGTWDYVRSPAEASEPTNVAEQDVIRNGFIYKPASVQPAGEADMLFGDPAFGNAREPFAAVFQPAGGDSARQFAVIVNHFKSKGSGVNDGTGQGNANLDRVAQAQSLASYAEGFSAERGVDAVFLTGDFNAYSQEDPMQVLYGEGFTALDAEGKHTYSFEGQSGSLDHVLANDAALALVTGVDIWEINANETVFQQYSRYNYNATLLYDQTPYSASDHNPEVVGIDVPEPRGDVELGMKVTPAKVVAGQHRPKMHVAVTSVEGLPVEGEVTVSAPGIDTFTAPVVDGEAQVRLSAFTTAGTHELTVWYGGSGTLQEESTTVVVVVE